MNPKWEVPYDFNKMAKNYECLEKGLRKEVVGFSFKSMTKPTEISKCLVLIKNVENLKNRESNYLSYEENKEFWIELGTARTPVDYYIEIILQQMFEHEIGKCYIKTSSSEEINFLINLIQIDFETYLFELNLKDTYELAKKFKENGVLMFKQYPKFAQEYFCRGSKLLMSYQPFDGLTEKDDGVSPQELNKLLQNLQINLAACLLKEKRYEDVAFVTSFVENDPEHSDKATYRRAIALYNLKKYEEAKNVIEQLRSYKGNSELVNLHTKILNDWKSDNQNYKNVVKKMFS